MSLVLSQIFFQVIIACRDIIKGEKAKQELISQVKHAKILVKKLDLTSIESIKKFAQEVNLQFESIDILINNAGVMMCPKELTTDGFEVQFQSNYLGHFLLTLLLIDKMKKSKYQPRIINVSSIAHLGGIINFDDLNCDRNYCPKKAYHQSKLAQILFTKELANQLKDSKIKTYSLHPGKT